jgi:hypothetical protein
MHTISPIGHYSKITDMKANLIKAMKGLRTDYKGSDDKVGLVEKGVLLSTTRHSVQLSMKFGWIQQK